MKIGASCITQKQNSKESKSSESGIAEICDENNAESEGL
jgi:hypothetical protein